MPTPVQCLSCGQVRLHRVPKTASFSVRVHEGSPDGALLAEAAAAVAAGAGDGAGEWLDLLQPRAARVGRRKKNGQLRLTWRFEPVRGHTVIRSLRYMVALWHGMYDMVHSKNVNESNSTGRQRC